MKSWFFLVIFVLTGCASQPAKISAKSNNFKPDRVVIIAPQKEIYVQQYDTSSNNPLIMSSLHLPGLFVFGVIAATTRSSIKPNERVYQHSMTDLKNVVEIANLSELVASKLVDKFQLTSELPINIVTSPEQSEKLLNAAENTLIIEMSFLLTENFKSPIIYSELTYQTGLAKTQQVLYKNEIELTGNDLSIRVPIERMNKEYKKALYSEYESLVFEFADVFHLDFMDLQKPEDYNSFSSKRFTSPVPNSILLTELNNKQVVRYLDFGRKGAICSLPMNSTRADGFCRHHVLVEN